MRPSRGRSGSRSVWAASGLLLLSVDTSMFPNLFADTSIFPRPLKVSVPHIEEGRDLPKRSEPSWVLLRIGVSLLRVCLATPLRSWCPDHLHHYSGRHPCAQGWRAIDPRWAARVSETCARRPRCALSSVRAIATIPQPLGLRSRRVITFVCSRGTGRGAGVCAYEVARLTARGPRALTTFRRFGVEQRGRSVNG